VNNDLHRFLVAVCLVGLVLIGLPSAAQQAARTTSSGITAGATDAQSARGETPYSADEITVRTQTLADGTKITHHELIKIYRDNQGRTRREYFTRAWESPGEPASLDLITIEDPVAGVNYDLYPRDHTGRKTEIQKPAPSPRPQPTGASANVMPAHPVRLPRPTHEDLGTQVIEGMEAKGERITTIIPEGSQDNDRPITITREMWYSATPRLLLMENYNDPRHGEIVMHLTNIVFDEPPAELFRVPADYTVMELQPAVKPEPESE
jgi:hypothetical protein